MELKPVRDEPSFLGPDEEEHVVVLLRQSEAFALVCFFGYGTEELEHGGPLDASSEEVGVSEAGMAPHTHWEVFQVLDRIVPGSNE